jgi:hypothetical protein
LKDENDKVLSTVFTEDHHLLLNKKKKNQTIELLEYKGCPYWQAPKTAEHVDLFS